MKTVAVVGAGMAGLAAACALQAAGIATVVFEKSRGVGGRAATRRIGDCCFDHGAQYVKATSTALQDLIAATGDAVQIQRPVWTFTAANQIGPGDVAYGNEQKWTWPAGITRLAKYLANGLDVRLETTVASIHTADDCYRLTAADGNDLGYFDAILLTTPAPQSATILAASDLAPESTALITALHSVQYRRSISITAAFPHRPAVPWYALVNTDRHHPISWLACEHDKPGRAPDGIGLLIAQMSNSWATTYWDELQKGTFTPTDPLPPPIHEALAMIWMLAGDLDAPLWVNVQRWRYALPDTATPLTTMDRIVVAGDMVAGQGRVHLAIEDGWRAADQIRGWLG
ncbi:NAD(P)/FAD-dependent oxidoreductase [Chloroflexus sp.]|uniref:NAD(P)/FAD-dependent oxidoreductase n=1 Tax=Chloroflexus sp. TaxID=1904827 RepID=UPI002ACDBD60|nr:FAD-dependent oxidoreductase [Chloroflexus sp.]